jgi:hypothetical protein
MRFQPIFPIPRSTTKGTSSLKRFHFVFNHRLDFLIHRYEHQIQVHHVLATTF